MIKYGENIDMCRRDFLFQDMDNMNIQTMVHLVYVVTFVQLIVFVGLCSINHSAFTFF